MCDVPIIIIIIITTYSLMPIPVLYVCIIKKYKYEIFTSCCNMYN